MAVKNAKIGGFFVPGNCPPENRKFELLGQLVRQLVRQKHQKNMVILGGIIRFLCPKMALLGTF
jgi:hypothetical protein